MTVNKAPKRNCLNHKDVIPILFIQKIQYLPIRRIDKKTILLFCKFGIQHVKSWQCLFRLSLK